MDFKILITQQEKDYELIDSGEGEKLERFGEVIIRRPDPQALWKKSAEPEWQKAGAVFSRDTETKKGEWQTKKNLPEHWQISLTDLKFWIKLTPFKHVGVFPEQAPNWQWIGEIIQKNTNSSPLKILNIFGYTGGATLAAAQAGAEVVHLDGSKAAVTWAKENAELSGLASAPIRWIVDDARVFLKREIKRGNFYDGIIMDPPAFGRGPDGEVWKIEDDFLALCDLCKKVLSPKPKLFLINGYASGYSAIAYKNILAVLMKEYKGMLESGEVTLEESLSKRLLPAGIFSRWKSL